MKNILYFLTAGAFAIGASLSAPAAAADLVLTPVQSKAGGTAVALDIISDGDVSGFQFVVSLGKHQAASVDLSKCLAELPSGFSGDCKLTNGQVRVIAMANTTTALPAGSIPVGSLIFSSRDMAKVSQSARGASRQDSRFTLSEVKFADPMGKSIPVNTQIAK